MKITILASVFITFLYAVPAARAADTDLMAALRVMGYGYKVRVLVNGADVGVKGGKSEGRRLFSKNDPNAAKATPQIRAKNFVLVRGVNDIAIEYSKSEGTGKDQLEITLEAEGYPQPLLKLVNRGKDSDKVNAKVTIDGKAPAGFKPVLLGEAK